MTCNTALYIIAAAGVIFMTAGMYAAYRQQLWLAEQERRQRERHE